MNIKKLFSPLFLSLFLLPLSCYGQGNLHLKTNRPDELLIQEPDWLIIQNMHFYDGESDDLVTAGIGFSPLYRSTFTPSFADINQPTSQELRKAKLYRDINIQNGEGSLYGFKIDQLTPLFDGKVAGTEIQALIEPQNVGLLLQIPLDFDKNKPCIVAVPSSDSNGLYNARDMQIRGLWGLRHNCAVVYNDKGLGNGIYDISNNRSYAVNGKTQIANVLFYPQIPDLLKFIQQYPNRYAIKQLHSKQNAEQNWGDYVLKSIEFAFYELNSQYSPSGKAIFNNKNTLVLVYGSTDGGGAALKAGEQDKQNVIDGIVAVNPQILPAQGKSQLMLQLGNQPKTALIQKSIAESSTYFALYLPCAVPEIRKAYPGTYVPFADKFNHSQNRCDALKAAKLLNTGTPKEALQKLRQYGWNSKMDLQLPYLYYKESVGLPYKYISQYGQFDVSENMCGYSVASTRQNPLYNQGTIEPLTKLTFQQLWSIADGAVPLWLDNDVTILDLVNNLDPNSPRRELFSSSAGSSTVDYNTAGEICLKDQLATQRVKDGINHVMASGNLNQIKTLIIHGQDNIKQLPNYTSRAYAALNSQVEGKTSQLRYIEVANASYLDGNIPFDNVLVPIDYYGESAMNWLWANLTKNATLPDSQVVHAAARGGKSGFVSAITAKNLTPILQSPNSNNLIILDNGTVKIPE